MFQSEHLTAGLAAVLLLVVYCLGFPLLATYVILTARRQRKTVDGGATPLWQTIAVERMGYLLRGLKDQYYWFRLTRYAVNFVIALQSAVAQQASVRLFIPVIVLTLDCALLAKLQPFEKWFHNIGFLASGVGNVTQALVMLGLVTYVSDTDVGQNVGSVARVALFRTAASFAVAAALMVFGVARWKERVHPYRLQAPAVLSVHVEAQSPARTQAEEAMEKS